MASVYALECTARRTCAVSRALSAGRRRRRRRRAAAAAVARWDGRAERVGEGCTGRGSALPDVTISSDVAHTLQQNQAEKACTASSLTATREYREKCRRAVSSGCPNLVTLAAAMYIHSNLPITTTTTGSTSSSDEWHARLCRWQGLRLSHIATCVHESEP